MGEVWVFAEQRNGILQDVSIELLNPGRKIADTLNTKLSAILLCSKTGNLADELISYGADKIYVVENKLLEYYQSDLYTYVIAKLCEEYKPEVLLIGATYIGMDFAPRVAARLKTGLSAHIIGLEIDPKTKLLKQIVPGFGGGVLAVVTCPNTKPQMATVRPGVFTKPEKRGREGEIVKVDIPLTEDIIKAKTLKMVQEIPKGKKLEEAEVVIGIGRGACKSEIMKNVYELAEILGAAIGGTRPALDEGYIKEDQMIGVSGKTVRPKLHIALGVSGAMQYMSGVLDSKVILAINKDPNASIFKLSDIGIVGDLKEVLPILIEELRKYLGLKSP